LVAASSSRFWAKFVQTPVCNITQPPQGVAGIGQEWSGSVLFDDGFLDVSLDEELQALLARRA
jgi:hypothetical protein